mgnify:CR=1 FL=1
MKKSFENEPLTSLLSKDLNDFSEDELEAYVQELQRRRAAPTMKSKLSNELLDSDLTKVKTTRKQKSQIDKTLSKLFE